MFPFTLLVFFISGFAALLYQVAWQRMLVVFSGADVYSATIVVSAYMAGLGLGSFVGGQVADRVRARTSLALFALAELSIAIFGAFSTTLYYDVLYQRLGDVALPAPAIAALLIVSLLWPTFFMGASLPLLSRAVTHTLDRAARAVGTLYGVNTLGAAAGALLSTWVLLPTFGLDGSVRVGAMLNAACALALIPIALRFRPETLSPTSPGARASALTSAPAADDRAASSGSMLWRWSLIYACSGFLALSLEIVWFRLLGVMTKSNAFTFGSLLAIYLAGVGLGSVVGSRFAARLRRPATVFLGIQAAVGLSCSVVLLIVVFAATRVTVLRDYFGGEGLVESRRGVSRPPYNAGRHAPGQLRTSPARARADSHLRRVARTHGDTGDIPDGIQLSGSAAGRAHRSGSHRATCRDAAAGERGRQHGRRHADWIAAAGSGRHGRYVQAADGRRRHVCGVCAADVGAIVRTTGGTWNAGVLEPGDGQAQEWPRRWPRSPWSSSRRDSRRSGPPFMEQSLPT